MEFEKVVAKLKFRIRRDYPFFSPLATSVEIKQDKEVNKGLACTDGKVIYVAPEFLNFSTKQQLFLILHELMHILYMHPVRFELIEDKRFQELFNLLADQRINEQLKNVKGIELIKGVVDNLTVESALMQYFGVEINDEVKEYLNTKYSTEEAYNIIKKYLKGGRSRQDGQGGQGNQGSQGQQNAGQSKGNSDPLKNDVMPLPEEEDKEEFRRKVKEKIIQGIAEEKIRGTSTATFGRYFEDIVIEKQVPWQKIVKNQIRKVLRGERTWQKLHKKTFLGYSIIPGFKKKKKVKLVIGVDTSASIDDEDFKKFVGEILNLVKRFDAELTVAFFSVNVENVVEVKKKRDVEKLKYRIGYGGTSYRDFFNKFGKEKLKVIFTDGYGDQDMIEKQKGVIWITTEKTEFPFGKVVKYDQKV